MHVVFLYGWKDEGQLFIKINRAIYIAVDVKMNACMMHDIT